MIAVRWYWVDGSVDEFNVENLRQAEALAQKLYRNPDIVMVEYGEQGGTAWNIN